VASVERYGPGEEARDYTPGDFTHRHKPISRCKAGEFHLVRLGTEFEPAAHQRLVDYVNAQEGQAFGYLAVVGASIHLLTG
jgi:hypothetical protein